MKIVKYASINLALLLFFALNPYPRWLVSQGIFQIVFFITTTIAFIGLNNLRGGFVVTKPKIRIFIIAVIYLLYFTTPIVHQFRAGQFLYFIIFLQIIFMNIMIFNAAYKILRKIFIYISIFALIFWLLNLIGVPLLYYKFTTIERVNSLDNYRIYGLAVSLYRGDFPIGGGIERICGVFGEPGHFGIYLGLMLAIEKFNFNSKQNILLLITGMLTFSTAFYGILALGIIYRIIEYKKLTKELIWTLPLLFVIIIVMLIDTRFFETAVGRVVNTNDVSNITDLVENRVYDYYIDIFDTFIKTTDAITGMGYNAEDMIVTNWRGLVYRFGILGASFMFLLIVSIVIRSDYKYALLLGVIALLIILHRVYLMYSPAVYMMILTAISVDEVKKQINKLHLTTKRNNEVFLLATKHNISFNEKNTIETIKSV